MTAASEWLDALIEALRRLSKPSYADVLRVRAAQRLKDKRG